MAHLPEGTLRRLYDEPNAVTAGERDHYSSCAGCQTRFAAVAEDARLTLAGMAVPGVTVDAETALASVRPRLAQSRRPRWSFPGPSLRIQPAWRPRLAAIGVAATLTVLLVGAGVAQNYYSIFQPQSIEVLPFTPSGSLNGLPNLSAFGAMKWTTSPELKEASSAAGAASASGLPLIQPTLPSGIDRTKVSYGSVNQSAASFTFDAAKAQADYASKGKTLPAMPAGMDRSTLSVVGGPGEFQVYGELPAGITGGASADAAGAGTGAAAKFQLPALAIAAVKAPAVSSTGVSANDLKAYLIKLDPALKPAIDAIGGNNTIIPIPIPVDMAASSKVDINGASGVALGDNTKLGAGVIWEDHSGVVWAVAGSISKDDAIAIARSLGTK